MHLLVDQTHYGITKNPNTGNFELATGSARGKLSFKVEVVTVQDIRRATVEISEATRTLYRLVLKRDLPPPWEVSV